MINISGERKFYITNDTNICDVDMFQISWDAGYITTFIKTDDTDEQGVTNENEWRYICMATFQHNTSFSTKIFREGRTFGDEFAFSHITSIEPIGYFEMNFSR